MANTSNLRGYLKDVANSIRNVTGSNANILANEYDLIINNFILANETSLNITPMVNAQHFGPAAGYSGYNSINISAVNADIDSNIQSQYIVNGIDILGVTGSYEGAAVPDGIYINENTPTKLTNEAFWIESEDISQAPKFLESLPAEVLSAKSPTTNTTVQQFINSLSQSQKDYINSFEHHGIMVNYNYTGREPTIYAFNGKMYKNNSNNIVCTGSVFYFNSQYKDGRSFSGNSVDVYHMEYRDFNTYTNNTFTSILYEITLDIDNEPGVHIDVGNNRYIAYTSNEMNQWSKVIDSSFTNAIANQIIEGKTAIVRNEKITGTMQYINSDIDFGTSKIELEYIPGEGTVEGLTISTYTKSVTSDTATIEQNLKLAAKKLIETYGNKKYFYMTAHWKNLDFTTYHIFMSNTPLDVIEYDSYNSYGELVSDTTIWCRKVTYSRGDSDAKEYTVIADIVDSSDHKVHSYKNLPYVDSSKNVGYIDYRYNLIYEKASPGFTRTYSYGTPTISELPIVWTETTASTGVITKYTSNASNAMAIHYGSIINKSVLNDKFVDLLGIKSEDIRVGVTYFGVTGNMTAGEDLNNELNNQSNTIANLQNEVNILSDALNNAYIGINNINLSNMNYSETSNFVRSSDGSNYSFGIVNIPFNGLSYNGGSLAPTTNSNNAYYNVYRGVKTLTSFDTSNVTNMSYMFSGFYSLTNVPNFNTSNAKYFGRMFENCVNLVDVPTFASNNLYDMSYMFLYCNNLSNESILNIANMCINAVNYGRTKNLSNTFQQSPLYGTKFDNSYYTELWDALNNAGWTY